jgi:hypothetical protein
MIVTGSLLGREPVFFSLFADGCFFFGEKERDTVSCVNGKFGSICRVYRVFGGS